jgi:hypothetical protein
VHVRLAGPFATAPADGEPVVVAEDGGAGGLASDVALTGVGDVTTPCMRVSSPGWYVAVLDSPGRPAGDADGAAIAPFADHVAHAGETFHVTPPPAGDVRPSPGRAQLAMTGGAPGIDVPGSGGTQRMGAQPLACAAAALGALGTVGIGARRAGRRRIPARASRWARS